MVKEPDDRIAELLQWLHALPDDEQQAVVETVHRKFHALDDWLGTDEHGFRNLHYPRASLAWELTRLEHRFLASLRDLRDEWDFCRLLGKAG